MAALFALCLCCLAAPCTGVRADYRLGPERSGSYSIAEEKLYDEYGRVDFTAKSTATVKSQDKVTESIEGVASVSTIVENKDWRITLESGKYNYAAGEAIDVRACLEYIGKGDLKEIKICDPVLGFYVESSTGTYICQYAAYSSSEPNLPKQFVKGEKYEVKLDLHEWDAATPGDYDMAKVVAMFHDENGNFILPKGTYTVKAGMTDHASRKSTLGRRTDFFATLHINVDTEGEVFTAGDNLFRTLGEDEAVLIGNTADADLYYTGEITGEEWVIPSTVEYKGKKRSVTVIGDEGQIIEVTDPDDGSAYFNRYGGFAGKTFSSIKIPSTVNLISKRALVGVHGMKEVTVEATDIVIDEEAFADCSWGTDNESPGKLVINADTVVIGENAFYGCYLLQDVEIKAAKRLKIREGGFISCYSLQKLKLPEKTEYIGDRAFYDCGMDFRKKLTVTIPKETEYIGESVVNHAKLKLAAGNTAYKIENGLLMTADGQTVVRVADNKQKEIVVPEGVTTILSGAFEKSKAESLTLPDSLKEVPDYMIRGDVHLKKVSFGNGITAIGDYAFYDTSMKSVDIPASVKSIGNFAFSNARKLKKVKLHAGLESIGDYAFMPASKLKSLTVPNTVSSIGNYIAAGYYVSDFKFTLKKGNPYFEQHGHEIFKKETGELAYINPFPITYQGPARENEDDYGYEYYYAPKLSERVESIRRLGFLGKCYSLILPESLKTMDISFIPELMDYEEGGTLVFSGKEPPKITNEYDTVGWFTLLVIIPEDADEEAFEKAFDEAGLADNQRIFIKKDYSQEIAK
ncbi:MAG: leucine-rich repeat domain-containing protein [Lachnospiraceae bacterium]|nr:leucine-rich repeat domain-containing protein [Lachnospiraceae bacterium]